MILTVFGKGDYRLRFVTSPPGFPFSGRAEVRIVHLHHTGEHIARIPVFHRRPHFPKHVEGSTVADAKNNGEGQRADLPRLS